MFGSRLSRKDTEVKNEEADFAAYRTALSSEAGAHCAKVAGAGRTEVILHFAGEEEYVYAKNRRDNGSEEYVYSSGKGLLLRVDYPAVDGVSVLCEGGDDPAVKKEMIEILSAFFGIGSNRIHVGKGNFGSSS